ncbi:MAG: SagB/ThcOx family dehydrogenase [Bacteroidales bacterium]
MKLLLLYLAVGLFSTANAQTDSVIILNKPSEVRGKNIMEAFASRASTREFSEEELSLQDISDLLWAANGINRSDEGKRTAPTAMNSQDIDVYVVMRQGVYLYDAQKHKLILITEGDYREAVAGRQKDFAKAPLFCIMVSDISRFKHGEESLKLTWAAMDAAYISQNIDLFCAGVGFKTRPRAGMDFDKLTDLLKLAPSQHLMLNNPVSK